jgi:hypothetical protein
MATKGARDQRKTDLKAMMASAALEGGEDEILSKYLDFFDELDDAFRFFAQRRRGTILDLEPGQKLDRWETTVRLSQLLERDPELRAEMLRQPRYLTALMAQEVQGIPILDFLAQVKEVRFFEEEPGLHWLLLPACHRGCEMLEGPKIVSSDGSCIMCGQPRPGASSSCKSPSSLTTTLDRIHLVDDYVVRSLDRGHAVRNFVANDPTEAFAQASRALFGARPEELFGIHKVQLAIDTDTMICGIRLADHTSRRIPTRNVTVA